MVKYFVFIMPLFLLLGACTNKTNEQTKEELIHLIGETQGTFYSILYESKDTVNYSAQVDSILSDFDASLSTYKENSIISRINKNDTNVIVDDYFKEMYFKAVEVSGKSDGAFDITVAPLVNAWGFGFTEKQSTDSLQIDSILQFVGMSKIQLTNDRVIKQDKRTMLDPNALAQGQSVDVVAKYFESKSIHNYLIEIGGEVRASGKKQDSVTWKVGIDKPIYGNSSPGEDIQEIFKMGDMSLATSGNYRKFYEKDGKKYFHSINPKTGYPERQDILSVTVFAKECITADAYATACMILGLEKSKKLIQSLPGIEAYFIYSDQNEQLKIYYTPEVKKLIYKPEKDD